MKGKMCGVGTFFLVLFILFSIMACTPPVKEPATPVKSPTFPIEIIDQVGRLARIEKIPGKIISLAPGNSEVLYALGLEDKLVGVTEYCDYPEAVKDKPKIGGFSTVDIERVVEIQPDLILAANIHKDEVIPELDRLGLTAITLDPKTIDEVLEAIDLIGKVTGAQEKASHLVTAMMDRIKAVTDKTVGLPEPQRPRVLYILWHDPLMTVGAETRIHELIVKAGGINIAQDLTGDYPAMSLEAVILANPQIIVADSGHGTGENLPFEFAITEMRLKEVAARQNGRVYQIDSNLTTRPGPRIADGLEELATMIHPEIFG